VVTNRKAYKALFLVFSMVNDETLMRLVHSAKELKIVKAINHITSSTENIDVIINKVVTIIMNEIGVRLVFFILEENGELVIKNLDESRPLHPDFQDLIMFIAKDTIKYCSHIHVKQSRSGTRLNRFGIQSFISVPLMLHEGPVGAIILMSQQRSFSNAAVKLLNSIANQTASAIEHIFLKKKVDEKNEKIAKLYSKLYDKEAKKAVIDALTGLFNKRYFTELMDSKAREGKQLSLIMIDLDFFKSYNDTFGHVEGDNLLRNLGQFITRNFKDLKACRYGGEEFAIIVESNIDDAISVAENLRRNVEAFYPKKAKRPVTCSIGVGQRNKGEDIESFIKRVDNALYKAKESGRNQVQIAN